MALELMIRALRMTHTGSSAFALENAALTQEVAALKSLCVQAADALGKYGAYCPLPTEDIAKLIASLRKAAA